MKELIVDKKPKSALSESIRTIRTNLMFSDIDSTLKTVLLTSSVPGEGKSFIACNLACAFAQNGSNVLLLDCDMRRGRQAKMFKLD